MICDIVSSVEELDHCVEAHKAVYIIVRIYVDAEETIGLLGVWDAYCEASYIVP